MSLRGIREDAKIFFRLHKDVCFLAMASMVALAGWVVAHWTTELAAKSSVAVKLPDQPINSFFLPATSTVAIAVAILLLVGWGCRLSFAVEFRQRGNHIIAYVSAASITMLIAHQTVLAAIVFEWLPLPS
jgi:hypothetical protein